MRAPERLGKYLIRRELGRGAMGVVYEGYDPMIERAVAIKVLRLDEADPHLAAELRMRFRREAQAAGRLGHPGIVGVYEYGEDIDADATFIAMELVRGRDLKSLFDSGKRFTLAETGRPDGRALAALHHAHERGVVHRDVKPGNIILLDDGGVKVADFGIARLDTSELTQLGSVLGTVSHMSPEQLTGRRSTVAATSIPAA
jgi:serine/threonine-protein kinase